MEPSTSHNDELPADIEAALRGGNKIAAIKLLRTAKGIGLKDAKDEIDRFLAGHADIRPRTTSDTGVGRFLFLMVLAGLIFSVYYYLTRS
jgi:hypothetical protein